MHASTSAEVLEGLLGKHAVVGPVLEFRGVNKYKTTWVKQRSSERTYIRRMCHCRVFGRGGVPDRSGPAITEVHDK